MNPDAQIMTHAQAARFAAREQGNYMDLPNGGYVIFGTIKLPETKEDRIARRREQEFGDMLKRHARESSVDVIKRVAAQKEGK